MRSRIGAIALSALPAFASACASSSTSPSTTANTFHANVADPAGDAVGSAGVSKPPDLAKGTVDVTGGSVTFTIQFASGTFDRQTSRLSIELDTDQNPSTGIVGASGLGIDYLLDLWGPTNQAAIQQALPATCATAQLCYSTIGTAPLLFAADSMAVTVPLTLLGNASGRLNYRVFAYYSPQATSPTIVADTMPDVALAPAHVP